MDNDAALLANYLTRSALASMLKVSETATQKATCEAASRYWRGAQAGPKPGSREALFLAALLDDAARTLALVSEHRDAFAAIVEGIKA